MDVIEGEEEMAPDGTTSSSRYDIQGPDKRAFSLGSKDTARPDGRSLSGALVGHKPARVSGALTSVGPAFISATRPRI